MYETNTSPLNTVWVKFWVS